MLTSTWVIMGGAAFAIGIIAVILARKGILK
jgi:hypothetical protein